MARLPLIDPATATGKTAELLGAVQKKLGRVPNIARMFANSPAVLEGYLGLSGALGGGKLRPALREQIALHVAEITECEYCLAAHTALGKMVGLKEEQIARARRGEADDPRAAAAMRFARAIVETKGYVADADLAAARKAGFGDGEIVEIGANVMLNLFTNYLNHIAATDIDF